MFLDIFILLLILFLLLLLLFFFFFLLGAIASKKPKAPLIQTGSGRTLAQSLQLDMHRLSESDFLYDVTLSRWRP